MSTSRSNPPPKARTMAEAAEHRYKFNISMSCGGCSGAVERVLKKMEGTSPFSVPATLSLSSSPLPSLLSPLPSPHLLPSPPLSSPFPPLLSHHANPTPSSLTGIKSYTVSLESQTADITTGPEVAYEAVLEKIKKTGKKVNKGERDGVEMDV